jgi:hypothetical protein
MLKQSDNLDCGHIELITLRPNCLGCAGSQRGLATLPSGRLANPPPSGAILPSVATDRSPVGRWVPIPVNSAPDRAANRQVFTLQTGTPTHCKPASRHAPIRQVITLQTGTSPRC